MASKTILIIDDEADLVLLAKTCLESHGYRVIFSHDGQGGLVKAKEETPDLILLDVMMPGIDGFKVLERLKNSPDTQYIPVLMLTAKGESESIFKAGELGSADYLLKPFETKEFLRLVDRYMYLKY